MDVAFASDPGSRHPNEDWVGATDQVLVLLDGLSTPPGLDTGCIHDTRWYVCNLGALLLHVLTTSPEQPLDEGLAQLIGRVADLHRDTCDLTHPGTPSATVAILRAGLTEVQYLVLADAVVVLDTVEGVKVVTDPRVNGTAVEERDAVLRERIGTPDHRQRRTELMAAQRRRRNVPGGYWTAAANPEAAHQALVGAVARDGMRRAAVLSDGAAGLVEYGLADWREVLDLLEQRGPVELIRRVRSAEASDPFGERWPRYKAGDDATAAVCLF